MKIIKDTKMLGKGLILTLSSTLLISSTSAKSVQKPNIVLIMADDMGYSDIGCFGGEINTPNLDQLANQGVKFTQFYNCARCCPTRASLMTGLYPHESGIGHMTHRNNEPGYLGYLNDSCVTIPEVLSKAGYFTAMTGKWHSGAVRKSWPENRGFQRFFGIHHWVDSYFKVLKDCEVYENGKMVIPATKNPELYAKEGDEWYTTDVFTTKAIDYIREAIHKEEPFFQYVAYNAPHWPLEAHDSVINKYLDDYSIGYEALRHKKYERMKDMGIIKENWDLPKQVAPKWDSHSDSTKLDLEFRRAIYAAQIEIMDQNIGRIINFLKEKEEFQNTVIFFLSDNGCSAEPMGKNYGWQWGKNTRWNYEEWRKNSGRDGASQGRIWSITSNTPFRKNKRYTHEGGIATPLIVHWSNGIKNPGRIDRKLSHVVDIMATCVDLADAKYPSEKNGIPVLDKRGLSLIADLNDKEGEKHDFIFWEHEGHAALRKGQWKIVSVNPKKPKTWELYNMDNDRTETKDMSDTYRYLRKNMIQEWKRLAHEMKVLPWPDPDKARSNPVHK